MAKKNGNLQNAKVAKNDEFYTQYEDIAKELKYYKEAFKGKTVFCNCDDPLESNFTTYFILSFHHLGLKRLICTFYDIKGGKAFAFDYDGRDMNGDGIINAKDIDIIRQSGAFRTILVEDEGYNPETKNECWKNGIYGSGDFRSKNVINYLKQADIVVTNPPFSLFREYVAQLMEYNKKFLIIGNTNSVTCKDIFPYIKDNKLWLGVSSFNSGMYFYVPDTYKYAETYKFDKEKDGRKVMRVSSVCWFTNIIHQKRNEPLPLWKKYDSSKYQKYDNYDAIETENVNNIPCDYEKAMGVPITFLNKYCPSQFEILGASEQCGAGFSNGLWNKKSVIKHPLIKGKKIYSRIFIKKIQ